MASPPLLPAWVRAELAPRPGRWRQTLAVAGASTVALALAVSLQVGTFVAPILAFKALLPSCVSTWRNLGPRLVVVAAGALLAVWTAGMLIEVPWLLLPVFFVQLSTMTYLAPMRASPVRGYTVALTFAVVVYTAVFAPTAIGSVAVTMASGFAIGIAVATAAAQLGATVGPRDRLAAALAMQFESARAQLHEAATRFCAAAWHPTTGDAPAYSGLAAHLQLLELVRQDLHDSKVERAFVALIAAAEHAAGCTVAADAQSRQGVGRTYRRLVGDELRALLAALDCGLARYAAAARAPEGVVSTGAAAHEPAPDWPDFRALTGALRARQRALIAAGTLRPIDVAESINLHGFVQALEELADVLALPPEVLEHTAAPGERPARPWLPPFDRYAAQFAMKIALASVLAFIVGVVSHVRALETCVINPLILAQGSYGATIHKAGLRLAGVFAGGVLAVLTVIAVMPNTGDVTVWLLVFFAIVLLAAYVGLGGPRIAYLGMQTAFTYMIVLVADRPVVEIDAALWRFYGTVLGALILFAVFAFIAPDYAGRQIISRFRDLLDGLLTVLPDAERPLPPVSRTGAVGDQIIGGVADILHLAEEARWEGGQSGIDPAAAIDAAALLRRVAHRWALVRRGRRIASRPPLPASLAAALAACEHADRAYLERLARLVAARHHRSRVGSRTHRAACAAAAGVAATPAPDLAAPVAAVLAGVTELRQGGGVSQWPTAATRALLAEAGHLQRIAELLPALEARLVRMLLPQAATEPAEVPAGASVRALTPS